MIATAAACVVLLTAVPAAAVGPGSYTIAASTGAAFVQLTANNEVSGQADDVLYYLSTTGSGLHKLPFPLHLYNQSYTNIAISTNGNVQPGVVSPGGTTAFTNACLPTTTFGRSAVLPFWDDLFFDSTDTSHGFTEGVFIRTSGTAPHRKFLVSWQGHFFSASSTLVEAQVTFTEGSQNVVYVYGRSGGDSATIGIQSKQQLSSTQWSCNTPNAVASGQKLTLTHH
jgi:hypothetical protein